MTFRIAFYKGKETTLGKLIRWWDNGPYSHCELVFSDGVWGTSFAGRGVVLWQRDGLPENWDFIDLPPHFENAARQWFEEHNGQSYDYIGCLRFVFDFLSASRGKWICTSACASAIGMKEGWRVGPNGLADAVRTAMVL